jgi:hypothetical protein
MDNLKSESCDEDANEYEKDSPLHIDENGESKFLWSLVPDDDSLTGYAQFVTVSLNCLKIKH